MMHARRLRSRKVKRWGRSSSFHLRPTRSSCFERVIIFSPSINVDDCWRPVKRYIKEVMKVPTDREQVYFEDWDESALRRIINQQRKITETSKQLKMRQLPDSGGYRRPCGLPRSPQEDWRCGPGHPVHPREALPDLHHRLHAEAPPDQLRGRRQLPVLHGLAPAQPAGEDSLLEELTALLPKRDLEAIYEKAGSPTLASC